MGEPMTTESMTEEVILTLVRLAENEPERVTKAIRRMPQDMRIRVAPVMDRLVDAWRGSDHG